MDDNEWERDRKREKKRRKSDGFRISEEKESTIKLILAYCEISFALDSRMGKWSLKVDIKLSAIFQYLCA